MVSVKTIKPDTEFMLSCLYEESKFWVGNFDRNYPHQSIKTAVAYRVNM